MKPVSPVLPNSDVPEIVFAKNQPQYMQLPAIFSVKDEGRVTTRWKVGFWGRLRILFSGSVYCQVLTFHHPLQPLLLMAEKPSVQDCL